MTLSGTGPVDGMPDCDGNGNGDGDGNNNSVSLNGFILLTLGESQRTYLSVNSIKCDLNLHLSRFVRPREVIHTYVKSNLRFQLNLQ
jgi:hypothetical protein